MKLTKKQKAMCRDYLEGKVKDVEFNILFNAFHNEYISLHGIDNLNEDEKTTYKNFCNYALKEVSMYDLVNVFNRYADNFMAVVETSPEYFTLYIDGIEITTGDEEDIRKRIAGINRENGYTYLDEA